MDFILQCINYTEHRNNSGFWPRRRCNAISEAVAEAYTSNTARYVYNEHTSFDPKRNVLFNPMAINPDPLRYNGRGMFAVNGQYIMGYIDHGRHNFATSAGDCGAQILDSKGMLLGLHCAGATVGFTPESP